MSALKLDFSSATKATKKAFRNQKNGLETKKAPPSGVTAVVLVKFVPKEAGQTKMGNAVKQVRVMVMELEKCVPSEMGRRSGDGRYLVKRRELVDKTNKTYALSADETPLCTGDEITLEIKAYDGPLPEGLQTGNIIRVKGLAPKHHVYKEDKRNKQGEIWAKEGSKSIDKRTGLPKVFWSVSNVITVLSGYNDEPKVVENLKKNLPIWRCAFGPERATRRAKNAEGEWETVDATSHLAVCFGGDTKTEQADDGTTLFVHNEGTICPEEAQYVMESQSNRYKALGIMFKLYSLYDKTNWNYDTRERESRRIFQETIVRIVTRDELINKFFGIVDPDIWKAIAPQLVRVLDGVMFVDDPYEKQDELIQNIQQFVKSNELISGGNPDAQKAIDDGNGVQRGTVVTISNLVLNYPKMIRDLGTKVAFEDMVRVTNNFEFNQLDAFAMNNILQQNQDPQPYNRDWICLSTFRKSIDAASLKDYDFYLVTHTKKWNNGSGKSSEEVIQEYEANDDPDRDAEDRTFDTRHCLFYAVHRRTSTEMRDEVEGLSGDMFDEEPMEVQKSENKRKRDKTEEPDDDLFGEDDEEDEEPIKKKKKKNKKKEKEPKGFEDDE